jgi:hypothetical protein
VRLSSAGEDSVFAAVSWVLLSVAIVNALFTQLSTLQSNTFGVNKAENSLSKQRECSRKIEKIRS